MTFLKWAIRSFAGHVALFQLILGLPFFLWFVISNQIEGTLTLSFTLRFMVEDFVICVAVAFAFWHTVTLPLIRAAKK